jgi:hypothetical protein
VRIKEEYNSKIGFKTRSGHYEFTVVPFGLSNALVVFMCLMNIVFRSYLDNDQGIKFCSKIQSARNRFKPDKSVGLIVANPTQLVSSQTDVGSERYSDLFVKSNRQKF